MVGREKEAIDENIGEEEYVSNVVGGGKEGEQERMVTEDSRATAFRAHCSDVGRRMREEGNRGIWYENKSCPSRPADLHSLYPMRDSTLDVPAATSQGDTGPPAQLR